MDPNMRSIIEVMGRIYIIIIIIIYMGLDLIRPKTSFKIQPQYWLDLLHLQEKYNNNNNNKNLGCTLN